MYFLINADRNEGKANGVQRAEHGSGQQAAKRNSIPQIIAKYEEKGDEPWWYTQQTDATSTVKRTTQKDISFDWGRREVDIREQEDEAWDI
jgi:hypothetical protein